MDSAFDFLGRESAVAYIVGSLLVLGGSMGFLKRRSLMSLIAGASLGAGLLYSGSLLDDSKVLLGYQIAVGVSSVVTAVMAKRFMSSGKIFPAGVTAVAGAIALEYYGERYLRHSL